MKKVACGDRFCIFLGSDINKSVPVSSMPPQRLAPIIAPAIKTKETRSKSLGKRRKSQPPHTGNRDRFVSLATP